MKMTFKEGLPNEPRPVESVVHEFTFTNTPGLARREIYKFLEAAGLVLTERQLKVLNAMLKHYKNLSNTSVNNRIQKAQDEIHALKMRLGEHVPGTVKESESQRQERIVRESEGENEYTGPTSK